LAFLPVFGMSQGGVHFEEGLTWQQVKDKAKAEHKYVFVDCFATWCGPCKQMDKNVYPMDSVGDVVNSNFVSVKVQCDTSKDDNESAKAWYADAHEIVSEYKITAYPTFLFFSPEGKIVHQGLGFQKPEAFAKLANEALDPQKQYYTLVENYQQGKRDFAVMPTLSAAAQQFKDTSLSRVIAEDYIYNYLNRLPEASFCTRDNFVFIGTHVTTVSSKARIFDWCFRRPAEVDTILHDKGFSDRLVNFVVYKEEIAPSMSAAKISGRTPNWEAIGSAIRKKFGAAYVENNILNAKIGWYRSVKDWKNYTKYLVAKMDKDDVQKNVPAGFWGFVGLNASAWDVFEHSDNKMELEKALTWSNIVITKIEPKSGPNYGTFMDTKANLLYKLGKKEEALELEAKASALTPNDKQVQEAYKKMQEGKPTWE